MNIFQEKLLYSSLTSFAISFIISICSIPILKLFLKKLGIGSQPIRDDGPKMHNIKGGTYTLGGTVIIASIFISCVFVTKYNTQQIYSVLVLTLLLSLLGFVDDILKLLKFNSVGVKARYKLFIQFLCSLVFLYQITYYQDLQFYSQIELLGYSFDIGYLYIIFACILIIASSNAVNLTDGLDGLVSVPVIISSLGFAIICIIKCIYSPEINSYYDDILRDILVLFGAITGSLLGFLFFNKHPASIFMGDTGSLGLGGLLGGLSIILKSELIYSILGGVFLIEALSVIIQVYYFKYTGGKRFFKMSPIHHHFEHIGYSEKQIVYGFWLLSLVFFIIAIILTLLSSYI